MHEVLQLLPADHIIPQRRPLLCRPLPLIGGLCRRIVHRRARHGEGLSGHRHAEHERQGGHLLSAFLH